MIRSLYPTDLPMLIQFSSGAPPNQAKTRDRMREGALFGTGELLKQWLPLRERRHTLVSVRGVRIQGLLSMRSLSGPSCWEIDRLLLGREASSELLSGISLLGGRLGIGRVFLCLSSSSPTVELAKRAGFSLYLNKRLYLLDKVVAQHGLEEGIALRPMVSRDEFGLFELHNTLAPEKVRQAEGLTFREWKQTRGRDKGRELVYGGDGSISGWVWLMTRGRLGQFEVMVHPSEEGRGERIIGCVLELLGASSHIMCLVPDFDVRTGDILSRMGFVEAEDFSFLVKELLVPLRQPSLAPANI